MKLEIREKDNKVQIASPEQSGVDNKLELLKFTSEVQSRIKKDITQDFTLAKLGQKDKEGIIEMTCNAYFVKRIMQMIKEKAIKKGEMDTIQSKKANDIIEATFDSFMNRMYMTAILNRNVDQNFLVKILAEVKEMETNPEKEQEGTKLKETVKKLAENQEDAKT